MVCSSKNSKSKKFSLNRRDRITTSDPKVDFLTTRPSLRAFVNPWLKRAIMNKKWTCHGILFEVKTCPGGSVPTSLSFMPRSRVRFLAVTIFFCPRFRRKKSICIEKFPFFRPYSKEYSFRYTLFYQF